MGEVSQLFSARADGYAQFRPRYPAPLFDWLAAQCRTHRRALDIAAGSGQASRPLTRHFEQVLACDASEAQLRAARPWTGMHPIAADAERLPLAARSADLVVVAQALHWFATPEFFAEAERVMAPGGLFCAWCYSLVSLSPPIDALVAELHGVTLAGYWPEGRASVDAGYRDLTPPFQRLPVPQFAITADWRLEHLLGYLRTWSAVERWSRQHARDPLAELEPRLRATWGDPERLHQARWPLHFIAGRPVP
ncbi:class I SAM-dependent methyltransferase [Stutzerimonas azotifigens]|uniref:class I SAM-dependent methyltransferase n=1 Tax=Stutzerimonas azotifigens TaxID=291995 RepID=UPI0003F4BBDC|nr:class I SAM-dependent methyltransferase [Stutzerimonas azotifigens]